VYPEIPAGWGLARFHFLTPSGDGHAFNLWGIKNDTGLTDPAVIAETLFTTYQSHAFTHIASTVSFEDVRLVLNVGGTLSEGQSSHAPVAGGGSADPISPQVAVLVQKFTGMLGKHFRGRSYIAGVDSAAFDSTFSFLSSTAFTAFQTAFAGWYSQTVTDGTLLALLHRNPTVLPTLVTSLGVEQQVVTQRRRNRKAAHH
jgi:hypothetical protein